MSLSAIQLSPYGAAPSQKPSRDKLFLHLNQTASFIPSRYLAKHAPCLPVQDLYNPPRAIEDTYLEAVHLNEEIRCHCEMRIQLFCQQLWLVSGSNLAFGHQRTEAQAGLKKTSSHRQLAEAHCSTLTSLKVAEKAEVCFAKGAYFFNSWNMTTNLPAFVNKVDSQIDLGGSYSQLGKETFRKYCITLLNKASSGQKTPDAAFQEFLKKLTSVLTTLTKASAPRSAKREVVQCYRAVTLYYSRFVKNPENLAKLHFHEENPHQAMWKRMVKEVRASHLANKIYETVLGSQTHAKELLVPGILFHIAEREGGIYRIAQEIITARGYRPTKTQQKYAFEALFNQEIAILTTNFFASFPTLEALRTNLKNREGEQILKSFKISLLSYLGKKKIWHIETIFFLALPKLYALYAPSQKRLNISRLFYIGNRQFIELIQQNVKTRRSISNLAQNAEVRRQANAFFNILLEEEA